MLEVQQQQAKAFLEFLVANSEDDNEKYQQICGMDLCQTVLDAADRLPGIPKWLVEMSDTDKKLEFLVYVFLNWKDDQVFVELLLDWMKDAVDCGFYAPPEPDSPEKSSVSSSLAGGSIDSAPGRSQISSVSVDGAEAERFSSIIVFLDPEKAQNFEDTVNVMASITDGWKTSSGFIDGVLTAVQELQIHTVHAVIRDEMVEWFHKEKSLEKKFACLKMIFGSNSTRYISSDTDSRATAKSDPFAPPK